MPHYACWCRDGAEGAAVRAQHTPAHLAHVEAHIDQYVVAGPLKDGDATIGSLIVVKAASREEARAFLELDPYAQHGAWASVEIDEFRGVAGDWVGGAAWKKRA